MCVFEYIYVLNEDCVQFSVGGLRQTECYSLTIRKHCLTTSAVAGRDFGFFSAEVIDSVHLYARYAAGLTHIHTDPELCTTVPPFGECSHNPVEIVQFPNRGRDRDDADYLARAYASQTTATTTCSRISRPTNYTLTHARTHTKNGDARPQKARTIRW